MGFTTDKCLLPPSDFGIEYFEEMEVGNLLVIFAISVRQFAKSRETKHLGNSFGSMPNSISRDALRVYFRVFCIKVLYTEK